MAEINKCCTSCEYLFKLYDGYMCKYRLGLIEKPHIDCCMWYKQKGMADDGSK